MGDLIKFLKESWNELKLVSWLTRNQMIASTWLVVLFVVVFAIYVGLLDLIVAKAFSLFV
ncbi:MAG TPA: preprotein translocase subunit SecE [Elusimicrobiota bacterium]|nr:preprotein translocase subunit SecE [Elusimicrobiota bacterium]HMU95390.1 preprotein translocase subunit SecE [Elusimicrobiota bacterium]HMX42641.1 preprotein translocase subunit SecE [Elusimicrobiota bacterium]HMX94245.1 preprotein translocase subunit SecE [Elusimicrobiota bacterium]HNA59652.1 preprotein translocase subunit SecE [Elusimicrobiota bacterium]